MHKAMARPTRENLPSEMPIVEDNLVRLGYNPRAKPWQSHIFFVGHKLDWDRLYNALRYGHDAARGVAEGSRFRSKALVG